jgi:hypothetical protein
MVTMVDEIFDRHYQAARGELNSSLVRAFGQLRRAVRNTFEVLVKIEYQSPWTGMTKRARYN